jgi:hypothetical protein
LKPGNRGKELCAFKLCLPDQREADGFYTVLDGGKDQSGGDAHRAIVLAALTSVCQPLFAARNAITPSKLAAEAILERLAEQLPVAKWLDGVRGVSLLSLAGIVGEARDLGAYSSPAKLWKRFGLAVIGGERQRKHTDVELALQHGYSPRRRSLIWNVGSRMIMAADAHFRAVNDERKAYELGRGCKKGQAHNRDIWRNDFCAICGGLGGKGQCTRDNQRLCALAAEIPVAKARSLSAIIEVVIDENLAGHYRRWRRGPSSICGGHVGGNERGD